jgi:hypothetical protein
MSRKHRRGACATTVLTVILPYVNIRRVQLMLGHRQRCTIGEGLAPVKNVCTGFEKVRARPNCFQEIKRR